MSKKIRNLPALLQKTAVGIGLPHLLADNAAGSLCGFFVSTANLPVMGGAHGASADAPFPVGGRPTRASSLAHHWSDGSETVIFATGDIS